MTRTLTLVLMGVTLAGCGSENGASPTLSTPPPPVTVLLNGPYDLVVVPAEACGLPGAPYVVTVDVSSFATGAGTELSGTVAGGGDALTLDMLYPEPGRLQGALSTRTDVALTESTWLRLRDTGSAIVSLAADGRAEVRDGAMAGEVTYYPDEVSALTCTSDEHGWSLVAR
jgi:hypothetical protein